jgi:hypothetical protein
MTPEAETKSKDQASTGCVLKFIAVAGGLVTIVTGVITLSEYWEKRSRLTAEITFAPFVLPAFVSRERDRLEAAAKDTETIEQVMQMPTTLKKEEKDLLVLKIQRWLRDVIGPPRLMSDQARSVVFADVKNSGKSTCESVSLAVPEATSAKVEREGRKVEYVDANSVIELGDLKPKDTVKVTCWTSTMPLTSFFEEDLKIVYRNGVGSILLMKPVSPFWVSVSQDWPFILLMMLMVLFFSVLIVVGVRQQRAQSTTGDADSPSENTG